MKGLLNCRGSFPTSTNSYLSLLLCLYACSSSTNENSYDNSRPYDKYISQQDNVINDLPKSYLFTRDSVASTIKGSQIYNELVDKKSIDIRYLPALTAIGTMVSAWNGRNMTLPYNIELVLSQDTALSNFVMRNVMMGIRGGFLPEIVPVFYRYKDNYGYFGTLGKVEVVDPRNGKPEEVDNDYNLALALAVIEPNNYTVLENLYESAKNSYHDWIPINEEYRSDTLYGFTLYLEEFYNKIESEFPASDLNVRRHPTISDKVTAGSFEVVPTDYYTTSVIKNKFGQILKKAPEGSVYLIIDVLYKNIDNESKTVLHSGNVIVKLNGVEYVLDMSEVVLQQGYGITFSGLNPLTSKSTKLVYTLSNEFAGAIFWQPSAGAPRIYLGEI